MTRRQNKSGLTNAQIAQHFKVHPSTVADWVIKGCPKTTLKEVAKWRAASIRLDRMPRQSGDCQASWTLQERRMEADTRKIQADVELRELRIAEKRKDSVSRREVIREVAELVLRIKERLLAVPDEFEMRFPAEVRAQCKADFEEFVRQLLWELSQWEIIGEATDDLVIAAADAIQLERNRTKEAR